MRAGFDGYAELTGGVGCGGVGFGGGDGGDEVVVVANFDGAAVGLDEVLDLQGRRVGVEGDPVPCCFGAEADAAHADHAVADVFEVGAEGEPSGGLGAFGAVDVVSGEGVAGEAEAGSAVTEFFLEEGAEGSGEEVGGGVGVAELDDADELALGVDLKLMELVEEGAAGREGFRCRHGGWRASA